MLVREEKEINGKMFVYHYSNAKKYILREDGRKFVTALDLINTTHIYTESNEDIPPKEDPQDSSAQGDV